jgi:hypothetical protein
MDERTPSIAKGPGGLGQEAASFVASRTRSDSRDERGSQEALRIWGRESGHVLADSFFARLELVSNTTSEAEVFYNSSDNRAWKRTWPGAFGFVPRKNSDSGWSAFPALPSDLLFRLSLQNEIFLDDIRVEGIFESSGPSMIIGQQSDGVSLVFSQPWIEAKNPAEPYPSDEEIGGLMRGLGFAEMPASFYGWKHDDGTVVLDAKPDNFIKSEPGIIPIDLQITRGF